MKQEVGQQQKVAKATKVRRSRQPRNAQLSVARRNERERNRVKMVNNGFALLREHLPVEDLQACEQQSDDGSVSGTQMNNNKQSSNSSKAKKFSKVETLRAAIQRIKLLEELLRSTDPDFKSIQLNGTETTAALNNQMMAMYDDEEPSLSVCEPLSCGSSSAQSTNLLNNNVNQQPLDNMHNNNNNNIHQQVNQQHHLASAHPMNSASATITTAPSTTMYSNYAPSSGHFVKLEPQSPSMSQMSPQQAAPHQTTASGLNHHQQQYHHLHPNQSQSQVHLSGPTMGVEQAPEVPSHTHIWIQQHQSSFMEQQQQYQQQHLEPADWYAQQKTSWMVQQQQQQGAESDHHLIALSPSNQSNQIQQQQLAASQQQQVDSPVWFGGRSSSNGSPSSQLANQSVSQPTMATFGQINHHQPHQISLYSQ